LSDLTREVKGCSVEAVWIWIFALVIVLLYDFSNDRCQGCGAKSGHRVGCRLEE